METCVSIRIPGLLWWRERDEINKKQAWREVLSALECLSGGLKLFGLVCCACFVYLDSEAQMCTKLVLGFCSDSYKDETKTSMFLFECNERDPTLVLLLKSTLLSFNHKKKDGTF